MDQLNRPHELRPIAFEDIPAPEEHARDVRRTFTVCGVFAAALFLVALAVVAVALWKGVPLQTIAFVVPIVMGIGIATFFIAYAMPVGLVSLKRLEIAYKMGYFGLDLNRNTASSIRDVADQLRTQVPKPLVAARRPVRED